MLENLEVPENRTYSFSVLFPFEIHDVIFLRNGPTFICAKILKCFIFINYAGTRYRNPINFLAKNFLPLFTSPWALFW